MTRLMVLGLLRMKPMSGYEIQQILHQSQTDKWAGVLPGSIYHALKKMDQEGLVQIDSVEQTGHRTKAIYSITEAGRLEFLDLIKKSFSESSVLLPSTLYTAITFHYELDSELKKVAILEQMEMLIKEKETLQAGQEMKQQHNMNDEWVNLTFQNIYDHYDLQIKFLDTLLKRIEAK